MAFISQGYAAIKSPCGTKKGRFGEKERVEALRNFFYL